MKWIRFASLVALALILFASVAQAKPASDDTYREQTPPGKMLHKLGRGVVNVVTCWVEVPRNIAIQWEKTDPVTGFFMGTVTGFGWGFARLATGVYDIVMFPFPVPPNYEPLLEPEFVVTDIWGANVPELTEFSSNDPKYPTESPIYPDRYNY